MLRTFLIRAIKQSGPQFRQHCSQFRASNSSPSNHSPHSYRNFPTFATFTLFTFGLCCPIALCDNSNSDDKKLTKSQFLEKLKQSLKSARDVLKLGGRATPYVSYYVEDYDNTTFSATHVIKIILSHNMDAVGLLHHWAAIIFSGENDFLHFETKSFSSSSSLSLTSPNGSGSIIIEHEASPIHSGVSSGRSVVSLFKDGGFSERDIFHIVQGYSAAMATSSITRSDPTGIDRLENHFSKLFGNTDDTEATPQTQGGQIRRTRSSDPVTELRAMGVDVFDKASNVDLSWDSLAGYEHVKRSIEDTVINALQYPQIYDSVAKRTREDFSTDCNRPKAVLFEGPPGTGKTLTARILARRVDRPMVQICVEQIASKWYGDSEKRLAKIFDLCEELGGAVLFIDEVDALAASRDTAGGMHEATRRVLSVVLQRLEGFKGQSPNVLVCATNRKNDLDAALLSRFDVSIKFDLPDLMTRQAVFARYAKQLTTGELAELAEGSQGFSCRDIRDVCNQTEREFASRIVRKSEKEGEVPQIASYRSQLDARRKEMGGVRGTDL